MIDLVGAILLCLTEMSDIGGFGLPGFHTGGRKLRASGTVPASNNMLLASRTLGSP